MISLTSIVLLVCVFTVCYAFYKDLNNEIWNKLVDSFHSDSISSSKQASIQAVYFKLNNDSSFDHFNSMNVCRSEEGVLMYPTINHYFLKPIFIPWTEMEKISDSLIGNKEEYRLAKLDLTLKF
ncbi:hypothetical protein [Shewanella halifaxensis]|uniref:hypothetical protein n=1 Tax=Shewanella halifaxensis TaxID=271098 RepID=UPI000D592CC3|nr:hypothetical protein [Shewanella halifaxensis]